MASLFPLPLLPMASLFPSTSQSMSHPAQAIPSARSPFWPASRSVHPFPAAWPIIPPPEWQPVLWAFQKPLCRRGPNHALQRTEADEDAFSAFSPLFRQPLSLSLSPLGAFPLCSVFGGTSVPVRSVVTFLFRVRRQLRSAFPGGSARHSPAGGPSIVTASSIPKSRA